MNPLSYPNISFRPTPGYTTICRLFLYQVQVIISHSGALAQMEDHAYETKQKMVSKELSYIILLDLNFLTFSLCPSVHFLLGNVSFVYL